MVTQLQTIFASSESFLKLVAAEIDFIVENTKSAPVKELLKYGLSQKGQMLRPSLVYFVAKTLKDSLTPSETDSLVHLACTIELLHTASLVHDDIIDGSELRRGSASIYKKFGMGNAILIGNTFYLSAFNLANEHLNKGQVASIINAASDMCCGEVIQQGYLHRPLPHDIYFDIITKKTASIIKYACRESAGIVGVTPSEIVRAQELGECLGILYQLADDCKDQDVNLEPGFDFKLYGKEYLQKGKDLLNPYEANEYGKVFQDFLAYISMLFT